MEDAKEFIAKFEEKNKGEEIPAEVIALAEERLKARQNKDWAKSDELRDAILQKGYVVKDGKDQYTLTKK
jgi:cysteinyl-tRNA synthetase